MLVFKSDGSQVFYEITGPLQYIVGYYKNEKKGYYKLNNSFGS